MMYVISITNSVFSWTEQAGAASPARGPRREPRHGALLSRGAPLVGGAVVGVLQEAEFIGCYEVLQKIYLH